MTAPRRILIAEDNESARMILSDLLRIFGYEVDAVGHGLAAVEACRTSRYDVVLMDSHMPVLDGLDATRAIRAESIAHHPIIIAITGEDNREDCLAAGMDDYLCKPVRPPVLRGKLKEWLDGSSHPSGVLSAEDVPRSRTA